MSQITCLIAAMRQESQALLRRIKDPGRSAIGNIPTSTFLISGQSYVLATSGMGARRAAQAAQVLVEKFDPSLIISFGIAGAVESDLDIGDVVLPEAYCQLDGIIPGEITPLVHWPQAAREAATQVLSGYKKHLYLGTAVTTSRSQATPEQLSAIQHPVLEMETAGIARVAALHSIPLLSLRAISDSPRDPIPMDISVVMDEDANLRISKLISILIHKPGIIVQGARILRNTTLAANYAAQALIVMLSHGTG